MSLVGMRTTSRVQSMVCSVRGGRAVRVRSGGDEGVEPLVALAEAGLHARGDHAVAGLDRGVGGVDAQARAAVAEVVERDALDRHDVGHALELEGLHGELVLAYRVE